jgi:thymidylate kinase
MTGKTEGIKHDNNRRHGLCREDKPHQPAKRILQRVLPQTLHQPTEQHDRFHLGEMVYAPMYRGYEPDYIEDLEEKLNYKGAMLVLLVANVDDIKKRFDGNFIREEHIGEVQQRFIQAYKDSKIQNKMILNTSHIDQYKAAKEVFKKWSTP